MPRIAGVVLPGQKRIQIALTYIKGIGCPLSLRMLKELHIDANKKADTLTEEEEGRLRARIEKETVEGELTRKVSTPPGHRDMAGLPPPQEAPRPRTDLAQERAHQARQEEDGPLRPRHPYQDIILLSFLFHGRYEGHHREQGGSERRS